MPFPTSLASPLNRTLAQRILDMHPAPPPTMTAPNRIQDFDPATHAIIGYCGQCGRSAAVNLKPLDPELTIPELRRRLQCAQCGSRAVEIRIAYIAAGGYRHS